MSTEHWDERFDVVVVGSGAGGMTAALRAQTEGLSTVLLEKSDRYGGTSAVSGGGIWIPCNDQIAELGESDSYEEALTYLRYLTGGEVPESRIEAYLRNAPEMVRALAADSGIHYRAVHKYPDYFPDKPGGKPGFRTMEPAAFDAAQLGDAFWQQREPFAGTQLMGRVSMDQVEAHTLFTRGKGWFLLTLKMMGRYWSDLRWRLKTRRDRRLTLGQAMVAALRHGLDARGVPIRLNNALVGLIEENGRVVGVEVDSPEGRKRLRAERGVVLATGGFESNQQMREQYLPQPTRAEWTAAPYGLNEGEGIRAGQALGAGTAFMNLTWGTPTAHMPDEAPQPGLFVERALPGCMLVNGNGQRFCNEAGPYTEVIYAMYRDHEKSGCTVPAWFVFDATFRKKYPAGPTLPGSIQPDRKLPKKWWDKVIYKADSLSELAAKIGIDAQGLAQSVERMNRYSRLGVDAEFGKGVNVFDRYYSDPTVKPNPCLGPLEKGPFYALRVDAGEIGTKGGLTTDERARVLREDDGQPIAGLYAVGNCSAAVMGRTYAGPGSTLGPAMTFAYIAAREMAAEGGAQRKAA
ncbi:FAD-dependent oxidoreductase [Algiphilus aromaticivorans]|uniref:FAD-dependent oxidoreductase n=1 Tax=Algiphilus aromaticivorans TaxID=382454 RepID=UPI0005C18213|nr:FAD-dependent oxidoreductase [Algiphilus aromaticivorans]